MKLCQQYILTILALEGVFFVVEHMLGEYVLARKLTWWRRCLWRRICTIFLWR